VQIEGLLLLSKGGKVRKWMAQEGCLPSLRRRDKRTIPPHMREQKNEKKDREKGVFVEYPDRKGYRGQGGVSFEAFRRERLGLLTENEENT